MQSQRIEYSKFALCHSESVHRNPLKRCRKEFVILNNVKDLVAPSVIEVGATRSFGYAQDDKLRLFCVSHTLFTTSERVHRKLK